MSFKDHFSVQAEQYSKFRPKYPDQLFKYLASLVQQKDIAWDAATGNGQAAAGLAPYFKQILASDASVSQIDHAEYYSNVKYFVAPAEYSGLESSSVDLVTVATAIHWLDTDKFYPEVKRVLKPGGVIAIWLYAESTISEEVDAVSDKYARSLVEDYWPSENKKAWDFENSIPFPFELIKSPEFILKMKWDLDHYLNYLYTWSSTQNYIKLEGRNPIDSMLEDFRNAWGNNGRKREIKWKLKLKAGKV